MANLTQKQAAKQFVLDWSGKGYEKGETSRFWIALLQSVYGIQDASESDIVARLFKMYQKLTKEQ